MFVLVIDVWSYVRMSTRRGRGRGRAAEAQPSQFDGAQFMREMAATMRAMARDAQREAQAEAQLGGARVGAQEAAAVVLVVPKKN